MRLNKWIPIKAGPDPLGTSSQMSFTSGHIEKSPADYDLYLVGGVVYVCRQNKIAAHLTQGVCLIDGPEAKRMCADFAKKWPRPGVEQ